MSPLELNLFGSFRATLDGESIDNMRSTKVKALLIYLAVERSTAHRREYLFTLLWPGMPEKSARHNLSQTLYDLRQTIPAVSSNQSQETVPLILANRQTVQMNPTAAVDVDIHQLDGLLEKYQGHHHQSLATCETCNNRLKKAVDLYQGEFLADFYLEDSNPFEDWAETVREAYRRKVIEALSTLADITIQKQDYERACTHIDQQLALDNLRERAHRQKIEVLALGGQRVEAMRQYRQCAQLLAEQLGVSPSQETTALYERIRSEDLAATLPQLKAATPKTTTPPHNLVPQLLPFIGRQEELAALDEMFSDPEIRLITIVGPGGMGKTQLAIACAEQQLSPKNAFFQHGVFFISFAQMHEVDRIVFTVAEAINLKIEGTATLEQSPKLQLLNYLRGKQMLLLLDNFEHLTSEAGLLTEILQTAPGIKLLVTSRERLNLKAEQIFTIGGLPFSDGEAPDAVAESPAVQLIIQSARRFRSDYQISGNEDLTSLFRICRLVGGMPLALELAAGWVDTLSLAMIAAEIERSLDFLESDLRDIPERHRGIRAIFDPTWEQLDKGEREVFSRFSIFRGGCTREAAQVITGASLQTLASLSKKPLIQYRSTEGRYTIHELMRQYAAEKLAMIPENETAIQDAHCSYYCTALGKWEADMKSARQSTALGEIQADSQNIHAAWDWAVEKINLRYLASAARGLSEYYEITYRSADAEMMFSRATQRIQAIFGPEPETAEAALLLAFLVPRQLFITGLGIFLGTDYVNENLERLLLQSLALLETPALTEVDTRREEAFIRMQLGMVANVSRREHLERSLRLYAALGDDVGIMDVFYKTFTDLDTVGDIQEILTRNLLQLRKSGDPERIVRSLIVLGRTVSKDGNYHKALQIYEDAYAVARTGGHPMGMANARRYAAFYHWFLGEFDHALRCMKEGLDLCHRTGNRYRAGLFYVESGLAEAYRGQFSSAIDLIEEGISCYQHSVAPFNYPVLAYAYLHAGQYELGWKMAKKDTGDLKWPWCPLVWLALTEGRYSEALAESQRMLMRLRNVDPEWYAWTQAPLGFALHRSGRNDQAKRELYEALQYCVKSRAFLPLMHLMPIIPVVLAAGEDDKLKERAIELYTMAKNHPFVANSKLFEDIAEGNLQAATAHLPQDVIQAAQTRGKALDWWETATVLLEELRELGWADLSN
jgi:DNA-binding SARP family transcriptional activator/predicted ATPase